MSDRYSPQRVLQTIQRLHLTEWRTGRLYEAKRRFEDLHYLKIQDRQGELSAQDVDRLNLALGWLADLYFGSRVPTEWGEIIELFAKELPKLGREIAAIITELGEAATQFSEIEPDALFNAAELLNSDAEGRLGVKGDSPQAVLRDCRSLMQTAAVGGSPAHIAAGASLKRFREHAIELLVDEICAMEPTAMLNRLDELHKKRLHLFLSHDELVLKWKNWTVLGAPAEQTRQCEKDLANAEAHLHEGRDVEAVLVGVMKHIAAMMEANRIDAGPVRKWLDVETCPPGSGLTDTDKTAIAEGVKASLAALRELASTGKLLLETDPKASDDSFYLVTLDQIAAVVGRKKRTLERRLKDMPLPHVQGVGGKPSLWNWPVIRPWLEKEFAMMLPRVFPANIG